MWNFNWDGKSDYDVISDGKHYLGIYTLDFGHDPKVKNNWERQGEYEFFVTTQPPEVEIDDYESLVVNDDRVAITGTIYDFLLDSKLLGKDAIKEALLFSDVNPREPVPIDFSSDGDFELDLALHR
ncbi:MAG: hypothetical protein R2883_03590 [Caldisericia bacterium]